VKQVGAPGGLDSTFGVAAMRGSHGIGHTRLSTESRVDLSHSQPFWAHGVADLATVHNGHITNYDRLRRLYEQKGVRFFSENDSEVIGVYLADQLERLRDHACGALHLLDLRRRFADDRHQAGTCSSAACTSA
jgi:glutamate synthase domain-containing protein 1